MNRSGFVSGALFFNASATFTCVTAAMTESHRRVESSGKAFEQSMAFSFFRILDSSSQILPKMFISKYLTTGWAVCFLNRYEPMSMFGFFWLDRNMQNHPFLWKKNMTKLLGKMSITPPGLGSRSREKSGSSLGRTDRQWDSQQHFHTFPKT